MQPPYRVLDDFVGMQMEIKAELLASHLRWQALQRAELLAPDSWLGLIGLFWLEPGENRVGRAPDCVVGLPFGPIRLGSLWVDGKQVAWQPANGTDTLVDGGFVCDGRQPLLTDRDGRPSEIGCGTLVLFVIEREGRLAVRLRNREWAAGRPKPERVYFDYEPSWKISADWKALVAPLSMTIPNISGDLNTVDVGHEAVFSVAGQDVRLLPMSVTDNEVFFVFRDQSSGKETYGAGRFLKVPPAVDGKISLDFNFAFNPPCAFTPFATCPLPPPENWLPFAIAAGEKKPVV